MSSRKNLYVRRVRSSLVATFGKANPPLVWRFDLERNHSFTMALQEHDREWELGTSSPKGEFHTVARFPLKEDAEDALERVGEVLGEGRCNWMFGFLRNLGIFLLLFFMALWGWSIYTHRLAPPAPVLTPAPQPEPPQTQQQPPTEAAPAPTGSASEQVPPTTPNGIPLPADEVLKPPPN